MARNADTWCTMKWWSCGCCCQTLILPIICSLFFIIALSVDDLGTVHYKVPEMFRESADKDKFRIQFGSILVKYHDSEEESVSNVHLCKMNTDEWDQMCGSGKAYLFFGLFTFFLYYVVSFWHLHLHKGIRQQIVFQDCFDAMPYSSKIRIALSFTPMISWFFWLCACWAAYHDALARTYDSYYTTKNIGRYLIDESELTYFLASTEDPELFLGASFWFIWIIFGLMLPLTSCCCCQPELYKDIVGRQTGVEMNDHAAANSNSFNGSVPMPSQNYDQGTSNQPPVYTNETPYTTAPNSSSGSSIIVPQE